jgi:pimeloyl-ACP methyl ester carboxylesterase
MGSMHDQYFHSADVSIRFVDEGEGTPVILVHGYTGTIEMWTPTVSLLSGQFRVIALDCRGHGRSDKPRDLICYGMEMVTDLVRLLDWLEIERAHIVGYSMGAEIALKLATAYPDRVRSLVMGGSGWSGTGDFENYQRLAESLERSSSFGPIIRAMTPNGEHGPKDEEVSAADKMLRGQDIKALVAVARAMDKIIDVSRDELSGILVPVLGISGENDPERDNLERMAGVVPNYSMQVLDGRNHMDAVSDPEYNLGIVKFLTSQQ